MKKVYDLNYYRLKKQNAELFQHIENTIEDKKSLKMKVHALKENLFKWYETEQVLRNWDDATYQSNVRLAHRVFCISAKDI